LFYICVMAAWSFMTKHARALVCIARDPGVRLREIADALGVTERRAFAIVSDLTEAGYVVKERDGRRNRYRIQEHLPLRVRIGREPTVGELLGVLVETGPTDSGPGPDQDAQGSTRRTRGDPARTTRPPTRG
jgi:DNA-binding transcriptional ArsR family regulator